MSVKLVVCLLRLQVFAVERPKSFILLEVEAEIFRPRILSTVQKDTCLLSHPQRAVFIFNMKCFQPSIDESGIVHGLRVEASTV